MNPKLDAIQPRWTLPRGRSLLRALQSNPLQEYLLYIPNNASPESKLLVSMNGISSNASQHAQAFAPLCDRTGTVLLVPIMTTETNPDYQRLGRREGGRADLVLHDMIKEVSFLASLVTAKVLLFGFSGGAQFVHRYAMAHPHRVERAAVAASGWYTFPDTTQRYPYGIRPARNLRGVAFNPEEFLTVPMRVLVGASDTGVARLRSTERTNSQQGLNRVERARNWAGAMRQAAIRHGMPPLVELTVVPEVGHSFREFCEKGNLMGLAADFLLERATTTPKSGRWVDRNRVPSPSNTAHSEDTLGTTA